jgi:hypothetical protein
MPVRIRLRLMRFRGRSILVPQDQPGYLYFAPHIGVSDTIAIEKALWDRGLAAERWRTRFSRLLRVFGWEGVTNEETEFE